MTNALELAYAPTSLRLARIRNERRIIYLWQGSDLRHAIANAATHACQWMPGWLKAEKSEFEVGRQHTRGNRSQGKLQGGAIKNLET